MNSEEEDSIDIGTFIRTVEYCMRLENELDLFHGDGK